MFRKRILSIALALLLLISLTGCLSFGGGNITRGNGRMTDGSVSYEGSITSIVVSMGATINLSPEASNEVRYTIDDNLVDLLDITVQNGVLRIETRNNRSITSDGIVFHIGSDALESILINGAAAIRGTGTFTAETFSFELNGAGSADLALNAGRVSMEINGAGDVSLSGEAEDLYLRISGAGSIYARHLIAQHASATLEGVGSIEVHAEQTLDASVGGVGSVTYWGDPALTSAAAGLGSVRRGS